MSKKVFFDARYIREVPDGIGRFSTNLFASLAQRMPVTAIISDEKQLVSLPAGTNWVKLHKPTSVFEPFSAFFLNRHKPDVVFSPMQTLGSWGRRFKLILTVHDLIYYHHPVPPPHLNAVIRFGWRLFHLSYAPERFLLSGASAVATVSEITKRELIAKRLTSRPIGVIHNAPERTAKPAVRTDVPEKTLIYMGTFMPYKDVETLIRGVALLGNYTLELLSSIAPARKAELANLASQLGAKVEFFDGVSDEQYREHLAKTTALVSASRDEGFGIPLVEAMNLGVPLVITDIDIFHEVAGDAGIYFEAGNAHAFAAAVRRLETKPTSPKKLIAQSKTFDWQLSARALQELIDSL
jgi:glycosyltransferase involved in cell wall biosynthesis